MVILMQPEDMSDSRWPQLLNYFISLTFLDGSTVILQDMCVILDFALILTLHAPFLSRVTSFFMLSLTSCLSLHPTTTLRPWGKRWLQGQPQISTSSHCGVSTIYARL